MQLVYLKIKGSLGFQTQEEKELQKLNKIFIGLLFTTVDQASFLEDHLGKGAVLEVEFRPTSSAYSFSQPIWGSFEARIHPSLSHQIGSSKSSSLSQSLIEALERGSGSQKILSEGLIAASSLKLFEMLKESLFLLARAFQSSSESFKINEAYSYQKATDPLWQQWNAHRKELYIGSYFDCPWSLSLTKDTLFNLDVKIECNSTPDLFLSQIREKTLDETLRATLKWTNAQMPEGIQMEDLSSVVQTFEGIQTHAAELIIQSKGDFWKLKKVNSSQFSVLNLNNHRIKTIISSNQKLSLFDQKGRYVESLWWNHSGDEPKFKYENHLTQTRAVGKFDEGHDFLRSQGFYLLIEKTQTPIALISGTFAIPGSYTVLATQDIDPLLLFGYVLAQSLKPVITTSLPILEPFLSALFEQLRNRSVLRALK